jgi:hypothetical protein
LIAIEEGPDLEVLIVVRVTGLDLQYDGEFGTADRFHKTQSSLSILAVGVVFVESVSVDVDRNAHMWQTVCAHGGGGVTVVCGWLDVSAWRRRVGRSGCEVALVGLASEKIELQLESCREGGQLKEGVVSDGKVRCRLKQNKAINAGARQRIIFETSVT